VCSIHYVGDELSHESVKVTSKISRLARAFYFLQSARSSEDIGTKLALYCSVFESIFSISNTELKHRLSETVAFFLTNDSKERLEIYKTLQMAYDIRSSIVHGDGIQSKFLKNDFQLLKQIATQTDEILRRSIKKVILSTELYDLFTTKSRDDISNYIQNIIFG
jgi:hypothetical protein